MKLDEEKLAAATTGIGKSLKRDTSGVAGLEAQQVTSSLSSTLKSLEPPPVVYENQLQVYEGEVRNHIKVEQ